MVTVDAANVREAKSKIEGCEHCHPDYSEMPFDWVLQEVTGRNCMVDFVKLEPARCSTGKHPLSEKALVELA